MLKRHQCEETEHNFVADGQNWEQRVKVRNPAVCQAFFQPLTELSVYYTSGRTECESVESSPFIDSLTGTAYKILPTSYFLYKIGGTSLGFELGGSLFP